MALRLVKFSSNMRALGSMSMMNVRAMGTGDVGSGSGSRGGGEGGSILKAGGKFGEMEAAREGEYFRKLQQEQLRDLKKSVKKTISFHKEQIEDHQDSIDHHKRKIKELEEMSKKADD